MEEVVSSGYRFLVIEKSQLLLNVVNVRYRYT
jgi:hypothetical protein